MSECKIESRNVCNVNMYISDPPTSAIVQTPVVSGTKGDTVSLNCTLPNQTEGDRQASFSWSRDDGWNGTESDGSLQYTIDSYCHDKIYMYCTPYNNAGIGTRGQISLRLTGEQFHCYMFGLHAICTSVLKT